ncbi:cold shock domain-containing protein [Flaviaesturariibacter amylovorans]|uniref:Cold shock domain-containing protein n=1 Tax=Flaviaesturariibacter amylovorans TaxID=1084520 RepID=A0ABP8H7X0_9BACT
MAKSKASFHKKELERKKQKQRQEKQEKMQERKSAPKKSLDDMMAYLDEDGNLTSAPPDPGKKREFTLEEIPDVVARRTDEAADAGPRNGTVSFFNKAKGFGFIVDARSGERIFVHIEQCTEPIMETDKVTFEVTDGDRGPVALNVRKQ